MYVNLHAYGMKDAAQYEMLNSSLSGHIDCCDGEEPFLWMYAGAVMKDCRYPSESRLEFLSMKVIRNDNGMWCGSQLRGKGVLNIDVGAKQDSDNGALRKRKQQ